MKTFIFLFIVILGLFVYIFFYTGTDNRHQHTVVSHTEEILPDNHSVISTINSHTVVPASQTQSTPNIAQQTLQTEEPSAIPEDLTFEELKALVLEINPHYPKSLITLNSYMQSLLPTRQMQESFIDQIQTRYHLTLESTESPKTHFRKHKLLWDWVNILR